MPNQPDRVRRAVGEHLRSLRQALGWTLDDVVARTARQGVRLSRSTLHRLECGRSIIPLDTVAALCRGLGSSLSRIDEIVRSVSIEGEDIDLSGVTFEHLQERAKREARRGRFDRVLPLLEAARDWLALHDPSEASASRKSRTLILIADCHRRLRHYALCLETAGQVLNLEDCPPTDHFMALVLHITVGTQTDDLYRAELYAARALKMMEDADPKDRAYGCIAIGHLRQKQGRYDVSESMLTKAYDLYHDLGDASALARTKIILGQTRHLAERNEDAHALVQQGLATARRSGDLHGIFHGLAVLAEIDIDKGLYASARAHYDEFSSLARKVGDHTALFLAWHGFWVIARREKSTREEERAERVLKRLLMKVPIGVPEAERFMASLTEEKPGEDQTSPDTDARPTDVEKSS